MKRKLTKTLLATTLCVAMLGTTCFAAPEATLGEKNDSALSGDISGDNMVKNPIYRVTIPTTLPFYIDPFEQKEAGTQIYSESLPLINKSNVPVQIELSFTAEEKGGSGVVFVTDKDADLETEATAKKLFLAARVPSAVAETNGDPATVSTVKPGKIWSSDTVTDKKVVADDDSVANGIFTALNGGTGVTDATEVEEPNKMVAATDAAKYFTSSAMTAATPAKLTFALAKATYADAYQSGDADGKPSTSYFTDLAASQAGTSVFRLAGKVNTKATWAADQLTVKIAYTINGLSGANYTTATGKTVPTDDTSGTAHGLVATVQSQTSDGTTVATYTISKAVKSVVLKKTSVADLALKASDYTTTASALTISSTAISAIKTSPAYGTGSVEFVITFADDSTETVTLVIS